MLLHSCSGSYSSLNQRFLRCPVANLCIRQVANKVREGHKRSADRDYSHHVATYQLIALQVHISMSLLMAATLTRKIFWKALKLVRYMMYDPTMLPVMRLMLSMGMRRTRGTRNAATSSAVSAEGGSGERGRV